MTSSAAVAAPPSSAALEVLSGLLRDAVLLAGRGTASQADVDIAMRLGAGHPAGPFEVLASLDPDRRNSLGLPGALPEAPASGPTAAPADDGWTGPVGVLGTGHMAGGIVEAVARSGRPVRVLSRSEASGARLLGTLGKSLDRAVSRGRLDEAARAEVLGRVSVTHDAADLAGSDVVVEAVAEDLAVKAAVLGAVDAALPPSLPLATNTSSFRVGDLRPSVTSGRPVLALHFFNPAQVMQLVEVVVPDDVPDAAGLRTTAGAWARDLGKTPVTCADSRGFVVNRLLIPFLNDAVRLHEQGTPAEDVDDLLRTGAGHPMGPLALVDLIGVDVTVAALESMAAVEDDPRIRPAAALTDLLAAGRLGRKTGAGFHSY
ncbi:3-hydroxybutyryl-CoA dehydrogenase [Geodermatophilus amargosae]|uniref:3-hydroxybutyryl-CoA dehydrogenase n=1 Tax=Geodermatophilus amargosae TaxID=1296565 RepID=A0A1I7D7V9_9ACTN|nr:3-hydroxyacyl-CoA dehydrogenase family protein [Geodermatophilus amargosae]SFU07685.1 3-hydroxybutyryl-CoA dehydrogenase [Geodermatophilus amargosae]